MKSSNIGSSLESLFDELGEREEFESLTMKKIIVLRVRLAMQKQRCNKTRLAQAMRVQRPQVQRLLDPNNTSLTIATLAKAAVALKMSFFDVGPKAKTRRLYASKRVPKATSVHRKASVKKTRRGVATR